MGLNKCYKYFFILMGQPFFTSFTSLGLTSKASEGLNRDIYWCILIYVGSQNKTETLLKIKLNFFKYKIKELGT